MSSDQPRFKTRVHQIIDVARSGDRASMWFDRSIIALILLNVLIFVIETIEPVRAAAPGFFYWFEAISVVIFSIEYALRIWTCTVIHRFQRPIAGRLRFASQPILLIDLLAILPFYLPMLGVDLRVFRLFRIVRIAKLGRYTSSLNLILYVLRSKRDEILTTVGFMLILLLLSSSLMYFVERHEQPDHFSSIPESMWWAVATLTTVGYGDVTPITPIGRILGSFIAVLGIGMFALPTGILGAGFVEAISERKSKTGRCPTCGQRFQRSIGTDDSDDAEAE